MSSSDDLHDGLHDCLHVPSRFSERFFVDIDTSVSRAVGVGTATMRQVADGELRSALLSGPVGCGKSLLAAATCNEIAARLWEEYFSVEREADAAKAREGNARLRDLYDEREAYALKTVEENCPRWIAVPTVLGGLRREMRASTHPTEQLVADALASRGLLVVDDLGAERATEWDLTVLLELVAAAYDANRQLAVTSNLTARRLDDAGYGRIVTRLADRGVLIDMATAQDYRTTRLRRPATEPIAKPIESQSAQQ
jgi:DNA replication protein DnaC